MNATNMKPEPEQLREFIFPRGIAGFSEASHFAFIYQGTGHLLCLQSIDQPEASFILTPWDQTRLGQPPELSNEQRKCLKTSPQEDILWLIVLNPFADKKWVTANLKAPIAINEQKQLGLQCILNDHTLELRHHWMLQPNSTP